MSACAVRGVAIFLELIVVVAELSFVSLLSFLSFVVVAKLVDEFLADGGVPSTLIFHFPDGRHICVLPELGLVLHLH